MDVLSHILGIPKIGGGGGVVTFESYLQSFVNAGMLPLWLRHRDTSGSVAVNSGSSGATLNGTISGSPLLAQTGQLGEGEAIGYDGAVGADDNISIPHNAAISGLADFTLFMLLNAASIGENNNARFIDKGTDAIVTFITGAFVQVVVGYSTSNALTNTSTAVPLGSWRTVAVVHRSSDKKSYVYINGVEASYSTQNAGVGNRVTNTANLFVGNNNFASRTQDALIDETLLFNDDLSLAQIQQLHALTGL
jgi:hypothetical protein